MLPRRLSGHAGSGTALATESAEHIETRDTVSVKRLRTRGYLLLALGFAFATPSISAERNASSEASEAQNRACHALYVQKLRAARDALARHDSDQAADYLVAAKEVLTECMKDVRAPAGSQEPERVPNMLSEVRPAFDTRQGS